MTGTSFQAEFYKVGTSSELVARWSETDFRCSCYSFKEWDECWHVNIARQRLGIKGTAA